MQPPILIDFGHATKQIKIDQGRKIEMILADKIINERKKNGWSQEELAEKLSVSRQSVSKWEGAQAIPDLQKIIAMAEIFGVTTDYLLKDEMEPERPASTLDIASRDSESVPPARKVSLEEANNFIEITKATAPKIAAGVSMCIISPVILIMLGALSELKGVINENVAAGIGMVFLLALIAIAVYIFITTDSKLKPYEYLQYEPIDTEYGVSGMVKERKEAFGERHSRSIAIGVMLCVVCSLPLIVTATLGCSEVIICAMVDVLLIIVSIAVNIFINSGSVMDAYNKLLEEDEFARSKKRVARKIERITGIYWCIIVAIYLGISFTTNRWEYTWIVWPVAALISGVVKGVTSIVLKEE